MTFKNGEFNGPRLMGNCEYCYYATDMGLTREWLDRDRDYECHRYPTTTIKQRGDYCGEFAWKPYGRTLQVRRDDEDES